MRTRKVVVCLTAGLLTGFFEMLGMMLAAKEAMQPLNGSFLIKIGGIGILWMLGTCLFCAAAYRSGSLFFRPDSKPNAGKGRSLFGYQLLMLAAWLPCYLAYFPAIYSYDGEPQLIQYTTGKFDNHHPLLHTLLTGWCYDLGQKLQKIGIGLDGMAVYAFLQMLLLSAAFTYGIRFLLRQNVSRRVLLATTAWCCLFPVHPLMAVSTTKDTYFTAFLVIVMLMLTEILLEGRFLGRKHTIGLFVMLVCLMLFRRNGVYMVCGLLLVLFITVLFTGKRKKDFRLYAGLMGLAFASVVTFEICEAGLMRALDAVEGEAAEALSVPLQQLARTYKSHGSEIAQEDLEQVFAYIPKEGLDNYRPYISDGVKQRFDNAAFAENPAGFIRIWAKLFTRFPESYVTAFLYQTQGCWYPTDVSHTLVYADWWRDRIGYFTTDATPVFAGDFVQKEKKLLPGVRALYESIATDCVHRRFFPTLILFAPAFYSLGTVFIAMALWAKKKYRLLIPMAALLVYLLTILAGPCILVRYLYPFMALMPWLSAFLYLPDKREC